MATQNRPANSFEISLRTRPKKISLTRPLERSVSKMWDTMKSTATMKMKLCKAKMIPWFQ